MSPETRASITDLERLRSDIRADRAAMAKCVADVRSAADPWPPGKPFLAVIAVGLHGWYTGLEAVLERIARVIDGSVPASPESHRELLEQGATDLSVRPAVVPRGLHRDLRKLLDFRHFFRHAYGVYLDVGELGGNVDCLLRVAPPVDAALDVFDRFLEDTIDELKRC